MGIKIQINSLEALERLIGNDNDLEIDLRNSIVQEFTKRHLKDLAKSECIDSLKQSIHKEIREEFFNEIKGNGWGAITTKVIKPEFMEEIRAKIKSKLHTELNEIISFEIKEQNVYNTINEKVSKTASWIDEQLAPEKISKHLDKLVDEKIKKRLGL